MGKKKPIGQKRTQWIKNLKEKKNILENKFKKRLEKKVNKKAI